MSVKEDWRRVQTVSDETLEENWKLMFADKEQPIEAQVVAKKDIGIKVSEISIPIKNYSGEAVLTIPEEDRVCTWEEKVEYVEFMMVFVSYYANCGNSFRKHRYDAKLEDVFKKATCCIHCGKKVKWKD